MGIDKAFYRECKNKEFNFTIKDRLLKNHSKLAVYYIRRAQLFGSKKGYLALFLSRIYTNRLVKNYGIFIHPDTSIGIGLKLPHPNGIIIGKAVTIGRNVTLYQQTTIGSANIGDWMINEQPIIGDGVIVFSGAKIIGDIVIADNCIVGSNAVVNKTMEHPDAILAGVPAKLIRYNVVVKSDQGF